MKNGKRDWCGEFMRFFLSVWLGYYGEKFGSDQTSLLFLFLFLFFVFIFPFWCQLAVLIFIFFKMCIQQCCMHQIMGVCGLV